MFVSSRLGSVVFSAVQLSFDNFLVIQHLITRYIFLSGNYRLQGLWLMAPDLNIFSGTSTYLFYQVPQFQGIWSHGSAPNPRIPACIVHTHKMCTLKLNSNLIKIVLLSPPGVSQRTAARSTWATPGEWWGHTYTFLLFISICT